MQSLSSSAPREIRGIYDLSCLPKTLNPNSVAYENHLIHMLKSSAQYLHKENIFDLIQINSKLNENYPAFKRMIGCVNNFIQVLCAMRTSADYLTKDVWFNIIALLPFSDFSSILRVCKVFWEIFSKNVDLINSAFNHPKNRISRARFQNFCVKQGNLIKYLDLQLLESHTGFTNKKFQIIVLACPNLVSLKIRNVARYAGLGFSFLPNEVALLSKCVKLQKLSLHAAESINYSELKLLQNLTDLKKLTIKQEKIGSESIAILTQFKQLQELKIQVRINADNSNFQFMQGLILMKNLKLSLRCITEVVPWRVNYKEQDFYQLSKISVLKSLDIQNYQITINILKSITTITSIEKLCIGDCRRIDNHDLLVLNELKNLKDLNLGNCFKLADNGLKILSKIKTLEVIILKEAKCITNNGLFTFKGLPILRKVIIIQPGYGVTKVGTENLMKFKKDLEVKLIK